MKSNKTHQLKVEDLKILDFEKLCVPEIIFPDAELLESFNQGVIILENHQVSKNLLNQAYQDSFNFFHLDSDIKMKYAYQNTKQGAYGNTGYFPFGSEKAISVDVNDEKEFFHVARNFFPSSYSEFYSKNYWPEEIDSFKDTFSNLFNQLEFIGSVLCQNILRILGYEKSYISEILVAGNSILRSIKYPVTREDGICAAPHTGIQLIGIQPPATSKGLEINLNGKWYQPTGDEWNDKLIINIGEMLGHLSENKFKPTLHRVAKTQIERHAIVFFYHPNHLTKIKYKNNTIMAGELIKNRLSELGL